MARLNPGDATTDFFLLLSDLQGFDADAPGGAGAGFAVFGEIVAGRDVAEKIYAAPVSPTAGDGPMQGQVLAPMELGRASGGDRVFQYFSISVVAVSLKKKT